MQNKDCWAWCCARKSALRTVLCTPESTDGPGSGATNRHTPNQLTCWGQSIAGNALSRVWQGLQISREYNSNCACSTALRKSERDKQAQIAHRMLSHAVSSVSKGAPGQAWPGRLVGRL